MATQERERTGRREGYGPALEMAVVLQLLLLFFAALLLDGGRMLRVVAVAALAHWVAIAVVVARRPRSSTAADLLVVRFGTLLLAPVCWVLAGLLGR